MIKVDAHCHSSHSRRPSDWFLRRIGTKESYTDVETLYRAAKARGMTFVTVTDHNAVSGALELVRRHPRDCFVSTEITATFPEDGCKIHVLVYGLNEAQFDRAMALRGDIYALRDYVREQDLACSVAHAMSNVNGRMTLAALEKLILLFNVFEAINGNRNRLFNQGWEETLRHLTPDDIERLRRAHGIEPWGPRAWVKGFTGGSDDHSGLLLGETHTLAEGATVKDFLAAVREGRAQGAGRHGDHKSFAFGVYKIAFEFARHRGRKGGVWPVVHSLVFDGGRLGFRSRMALETLKWRRRTHARVLARFAEDMALSRKDGGVSAEERIDRVYESLARLSDDYLCILLQSFENSIKKGDAGSLLRNTSAALSALFLAAPFLTTLKHMHHGRRLIDETHRAFRTPGVGREKRLLWFSDTVTDLNGVSVTMRGLARTASETGRSMKLVTSLPESEAGALPPNTINLPCIHAVTPAFYRAVTLRMPSLLRSIDVLARETPDEIVISTPGPVGCLGLALARLLSVRCVGVYHTDFTRQVESLVDDRRVSAFVEWLTRAFFRMMDEVRVPTRQYVELLAERGIDRERMKLFRRGIEPSFVVCDEARQRELRALHGIPPEAPVMLWAGRMGREKNLDLLFRIVRAALAANRAARMLVAGDGPELQRLRARHADEPRVIFAGRVEREQLCQYYGLADVFVFPSTTDTFGMVVLEAQACGTPCLVTNVGGPQEIVRDGETGRVLEHDNEAAWVQAIGEILARKASDPDAFARWKAQIRQSFESRRGWESVLDQMMGPAAG